jgi:SAM-dependent methyltransferase
METETSELDQVRERYARRDKAARHSLYGPFMASTYMPDQERSRAMIAWVNDCSISPVEQRKLLEIGCGTGVNLLQFLSFGFSPENLVGNELLEDRIAIARKRLPAALALHSGDAVGLQLPQESFDVVLQSTVFTSILDSSFKRRLAEKMWSLVRPGGGVLWYDFMFDNPRNRDVRGISLAEIDKLFPVRAAWMRRITLAPPIARTVTRIHPSLYTLVNLVPWLRTHCLCWIQKS